MPTDAFGPDVSNTGKLELSTDGTTTINVATNFIHGAAISGGALVLGNNRALGEYIANSDAAKSKGQLTVTDTATLTLAGGFNLANRFVVSNGSLTMGFAASDSVTVSNVNNTNTDMGGAFQIAANGSLVFAADSGVLTLTGNRAYSGAAFALANGSALDLSKLKGLTITGNIARNQGGAIFAANNLTISGNSLFTGNRAKNAGGAIYMAGDVAGSTLALTAESGDIVFTGNKSSVSLNPDGTYIDGSGTANAVHLAQNTTLVISGGGNVYFNDALTSGIGGGNNLTKSGAGFVQFIGDSILNDATKVGGAVVLNAGIFRVVTGASFTTGGSDGKLFTVNQNATLAGGGSITSANGFLISGTIAPDADVFAADSSVGSANRQAGRSTLDADKLIASLSLIGNVQLSGARFMLDLFTDETSAASDKLIISGNLTFGEKNTIDLNNWTLGSFTIISATNIDDITDKFAIKVNGKDLADRQYARLMVNNNNLVLYTAVENKSLIWQGNNGRAWDISTDSQWDGIADGVFMQNDYAIFTNDATEKIVAIRNEGVITAGMSIKGGDYYFSGGALKGYENATGSNVDGTDKLNTGILVLEGGGKATFANQLYFLNGITIAQNATLTLVDGGRFAHGDTPADTMTVNNSGNLTVNIAHALALGANVTGGGSFTKMGTGTLTVDQAQDFTGNTFVNAGQLVLEAQNALAASTAISLTNGSITALNNQVMQTVVTADNTLMDMANHNLTIADLTLAGAMQNVNQLTITNVNLSGALADVNSFTVNKGTLSGTFNNVKTLNKNDVNGMLAISTSLTVENLNVNAGGFNISNGNIFSITESAVIGKDAVLYLSANPNIVALNAKNLEFINGAKLVVGNFNETRYGDTITLITSINDISGTVNYDINQNTGRDYLTAQIRQTDKTVDAIVGLAWLDQHKTGTAYDLAHGTFTLDDNFTVSAALTDRSGDAFANNRWDGASLVKDGSGVLTLAAANTYKGATTVKGGTLALGKVVENNVVKSIGSIEASAELILQANAGFDISAITAAKVQKITAADSTTVNLGAAWLTVAEGSINGVITGTNGGLTKTGTDHTKTLTLAGVNDYTGATVVEFGKRVLSGAGSIATSSGLTLNAGTAFDIANADGVRSIKTLDGSGSVLLGANSLSVSGGTYSGIIDGSGGLIKTGVDDSQTLTLSGTNTYTGTTTVSHGTLALATADAIANSSKVSLSGNAILTAGASQTFNELIATDKTKIDFGNGSLNLTLNAGNISGALSGIGTLIKNGENKELTLNTNADFEALAVNQGLLTIGTGKLINVNGAADFATGTTLTLNIVQGYTPLTATGKLTFNDNVKLIIKGFNGDYGFKQVIARPGDKIIGMPVDNFSGPTASDYLTQQLNKIEEGKALEVSIGLTWYDSHQQGNVFDLAHGTFTIAPDADFSLTAALKDRTADNFDGRWDGRTLTKAGQGTLTLKSVNGYSGNTNITAGTLALAENGSIAASANVNIDLTATLDISGDGGLTKTDNTTLTLTGVNSYTGQTTIADGGKLALSGTGSIAASKELIINAGIFDISGVATAEVQKIVGANNTKVNLGGSHLTVAAGDYNGIIQGDDGKLTKTGSGDLILKGANTYTGATTINSGTLALSDAGSITASQELTINAGGTFNISAVTAATVKVLSLKGTGNVTLGAKTLSVASGEYSGVISGSGGLILESDAGKLTLGAIQGYNGNTTINGGELHLDAQNAISTSGKVMVDAGKITAADDQTFAVLDINADGLVDFDPVDKHNLTVSGNATIIGKLANVGHFTVGSGNISGALNNIGSLTKTGAQESKLTIENELALSGALTVDGGQLVLNGHA